MKGLLSRLYRAIRATLIGLTLLGAAGAFAWVVVPRANDDADLAPVKEAVEEEGKVRRSAQAGIIVPAEVARKMGLRTAKAAVASRPIRLPPFQGCLALDNSALSRVRSRFAGEVIAVGTAAALSAMGYRPDAPRPLRVGDLVKKGDLLAVVWSKDLGEKKSELIDAVSKLRADRLLLSRTEELYTRGSGPERSVREAERAVESDLVAVARAERTLRTWGLTAEEVAAVRAEADKLRRPDAKRDGPERWARVEVRSPQDGVILEKNLATGDIVDSSADLYKVGDLSHLTVWAHVYEEDLPLLQALPPPVRWAVRVAARPGVTFDGTLDHVGEVIDPNQHTALVSGRVDNPNRTLKVGQFVTVSVDLPPPTGEVELPSESVVEDGRESVVFVQADGRAGLYDRRKVRVVRRLRDVVYVRAESGGPRDGDRVVTSGALLLREAMDGLPGHSDKGEARGDGPARALAFGRGNGDAH